MNLHYDLELQRLAETIQKENPKRVCIQLPDGLKPKVKEIREFLQGKTDAVILFWAGSCYGACDLPYEVGMLHVDLLIQFGHSKSLRMGQKIWKDF